MSKLILLLAATGLTACAPQADAPINCGKFSKLDGTPSQDTMRQFANDIVSESREVEIYIASNPSAVGFWGGITSRIGGTSGTDLAVRLRQLRRSVAMQVAREQALITDGTPLVDPSKEWACKMLADSVASLDQGQSSAQLLRNVRIVKERYGESYPYRQTHGKTSE